MSNPPPGREPRLVRVSLPTSRPILTYVILALIVGIFVIQTLYRQINGIFRDPIMEWGALNYELVRGGEYYRLFTAVFLHVDHIHLFFNALALYYFGRSVETFFGTGRFGLIYLLGGLCGSVFSFVFNRGISVGASGAIFAVLGAAMVFLYFNRTLLGQRALEELRWLGITVAFNFALGLLIEAVPGAAGIDNWAHGGGFFAGIVLAWFMSPQYRLKQDPSAEQGVRIEDSTEPNKLWLTPSLFAAGLLAAMIYAVVNMR